ncbi:dipeptidase PepV [Peribacillus sp. SCS-155]|uniref:dipeptidase PepV n=1 Tax=Peribacillus sedimenti TaxID=3115297 RepID=UPI003906C225
MNWYNEVLSRKENLLKDLFGLLRIASVKDESSKTEQYPMGKEVGRSLDYMLTIAKNSGFTTKNLQGFAGFAQYGQNADSGYIGVLCHLDVMPTAGEWTSPPFEPVIRDGKLFARGAIDDKGPTLAAYYGLKIVKEMRLPLKRNVRVIFGTDEESGMSCMKHYQNVEPMPVIGFAPDAVFPIINAEKGQINVQLSRKATSAKKDRAKLGLSSFTAGVRLNMVPDNATAVIKGGAELLLQDFKEFCEDRKIAYYSTQAGETFSLTVLGRSAHGMEPQIGINAGTLLALFLKEYDFEADANSFLAYAALMHEDFNGNLLNISFSDSISGPLTVNPGLFSFKEKEEGSLHLNIRCPVSTDFQETIKKLEKKSQEHGFAISALRQSAPHHVEAQHPMVKTLQKVYEEETNEPAQLLSTGGATYARFMKKGVAFGACFPGKEMTAHQKDEYIEVEDLLKATAIYARAIYELANLELGTEI